MDRNSNKGRRTISAWINYKSQPGGTRDLAAQADILDSLSIWGDPPREFFEFCAQHGIATRLPGGGQPETFDTREHAAATIDEYARACEQKGYGGVDLDYEWIKPKYKSAYNAFVRQAADRLHALGRQLSICVSGMPITRFRPDDSGWIKYFMNPEVNARCPFQESDFGWDKYFIDPEVIAEACDEIRVMCYDMRSGTRFWTGPTSTYPWAREVMQFWSKFTPCEKLLMGLPSYGNDYPLEPGSGFGKQVHFYHPDQVPGARTIDKTWMTYECIHAYRYLDAEGRARMLFASDADSTRAHLRTVDELDLAGVSFFIYHSVTPETWSVLREWLRR